MPAREKIESQIEPSPLTLRFKEREKANEVIRAIPDRTLESGMSIEEIKEWFQAWEKYIELSESGMKKVRDGQ